MLEPSNNFGGPLYENEEEMREISSLLSKTKKKHDVAWKQVLHMEGELSRVKWEIEQLMAQ